MTGEPLQADRVHEVLDEALRAERAGRFPEARDKLRQVLAAGDTCAMTAESLDAHLRLGRLWMQAGEPYYKDAEFHLGTARYHAEKEGLPHQAAAAIHMLALLEYQRGRTDEALALLDESPIPRQTAAPGPEAAQWFHYRGMIAAHQGETANAERLYYRAHELYHELRYEPGLAAVCDSIANVLLKCGKGRAAIQFAQKSLDLKIRLKDRYGEAITLGTLGRAYMLQARYADAREAFTKDLAIAQELDDQRGVGIMLNCLGEAALLQKDHDTAASFYRRSLTPDRGPLNAIYAHYGLAWVYLGADALAAATATCDQIETLLEQSVKGGPALRAALLGLRGALAGRNGDPAEGERLLLEAIELLRKHGAPLDPIPFLYELRDLYQEGDQTAKAVQIMTGALDLLSECGAERGIADVEEWLRTVHSPGLVRLALERHLPDFLVRSILDGHLSGPQTKKQEVTVLFSDVREYTALTEGLPAEEVVALLNEWFAEATRAIRRHGGVVDKFIGDAVMALFGVPEPDAADPANAVRAALEMRDALCALNLRRKVLGGRELRVGIGIDSGEVVVGLIGSHMRQSYTAIGDAVNTASRLEGATKEYPGCDILISQRTQKGQQLTGAAETIFLGQANLKGKEQRVPVYQVCGLRAGS